MENTPTKTLYAARWLTLQEVAYTDTTGKAKTWEFAQRQGKTGSVCIVARTPQREIVVIEQMRYPLGRKALELPAGLIDAGESVETAALRELAEETGYSGEITGLGPVVYNSPGLTDESVQMVHVQTNGKGEATPETCEQIEVMTIAEGHLLETLDGHRRAGTAIDAKLWCFALGISQPARHT